MKLISYLNADDEDQLALVVGKRAYDLNALDEDLPATMDEFLFMGPSAMNSARQLEQLISDDEFPEDLAKNLADLELLAPVPNPTSCRDAYAFRQHVASARKNRGVDMIPEFDQFPIFYFTNHNAITGPGEIDLMADHFHKLDFELEVAIVIGKDGRNIPASKADEYIAGFTIMNDWSARLLQMEEMKLNLGPAKGKDFATSIGPWLVTPDELEQYKTEPFEGHTGNAYKLGMKAFVNGKQVSDGNMDTMYWSFAEIIERASYGVDLYAGDVIGSGTVGTGCFLELNGTAKRLDPNAEPQWLNNGDTVVLEIDGLGKLENKVLAVEEEEDFSLLELKKSTESVS